MEKSRLIKNFLKVVLISFGVFGVLIYVSVAVIQSPAPANLIRFGFSPDTNSGANSRFVNDIPTEHLSGIMRLDASFPKHIHYNDASDVDIENAPVKVVEAEHKSVASIEEAKREAREQQMGDMKMNDGGDYRESKADVTTNVSDDKDHIGDDKNSVPQDVSGKSGSTFQLGNKLITGNIKDIEKKESPMIQTVNDSMRIRPTDVGITWNDARDKNVNLPRTTDDLRRHHTDGDTISPGHPPLIIIVAQWRFGSTVIGELFDQNPDLFYMFEPLWAARKMKEAAQVTQSSPEGRRIYRDVLRRLFTCNFTSEFVRVMDIPSWVGRPFNRAICEENRGCGLGNRTAMRELCDRYEGRIATKVIRADVELLRPLVVDEGMNLKIIHLVRDPRGSAASRINYVLTSEKQKKDDALFIKDGYMGPLGLRIDYTCQWIRENVMLQARRDIPDWLVGRYRLVRYEDFAQTPLNITRELYGFAGIPLPKRVEDWVVKNTHAPTSDKRTFAMRKDSKETANHWVTDLHEKDIERIEGACMDVIQLLGYERYLDLIKNVKSSRTTFA